MKDLIWSLVERVFPRLASAGLMLLLAAFVTPLIVGLYAWPMVVLTLYYSALDSAIRQVVVPSLASQEGLRLLRRYRNIASIAGSLAIAGILLALLLIFPADLHGQIYAMTPLVLVPVANSFAVKPLGFLQSRNAWAELAKMQLLASGVSLLLSVPALVLTRSLLGASLQVALVEILFCWMVHRRARALGIEAATKGASSGAGYGREFGHASAYSIVGWLQGQADRLLIGGLSGTAALGSFSFATAIARNPGDAISASTGNVLRVKISVDQGLSAVEVRRRSDDLLMRGLALGIVLVLAIFIGVDAVLRPLLGNEWREPLDAALPAAISILPTIVSWSLSVVLLAVGRLAWGAPIKVIGIALAVPVALAATQSIELASWCVLAREVVILILLLVSCGKAAPLKSFALALASTTAFTIAAVLL